MALTDLTQQERLDLAWVKPIYLVHIELDGKTLYLSDRVYNYTYGGTTVTYDMYISNLADIVTQIGNVKNESNFSFDLKLYNDPYGYYSHLSQLHEDKSFLSKKVSIYEIRPVSKDETFASDVKTLLWTGYTEKVKAITKSSFLLTCSSRLYYLRDKLGITKVNLTDFPSADPDDVGKSRNIIYGNVEHVPCRAVKAGVIDRLATDISSTDTTIYISGSSIAEFPTSSFVIQIDEEKISISSRSGNTLTVDSRGYDSTTATAHDKGAAVAEVLSQYVYEVAQHPVKSIDNVYVDDIRQTSNFNVYTGQSGDQLSGYGDAAVIEFTALPVIKQQVNLDVDQGSHSHGASSSSTSNSTSSSSANSTTTVSADVTKLNYPTGASSSGSPQFSNPTNAIDGADNTYADAACSSGQTAILSLTHGMSNLGTLQEQYVHITVQCNTSSSYPSVELQWNGNIYQVGVSPDKAAKRINVSTHKTWNPSTFNINARNPSTTDVSTFRCYVSEVWIESVYTPNASTTTDVDTTTTTSTSTSTSVDSSPATGVSLTGNSSANTVIGRIVTANVQGYQDDASGTYTGTADALIERPDHVIKHMLIELLGMTASDIGDSFADSGALYASAISGGYKFAFLANEISEKANAVLYTLAHDCRSLLYDYHGKFELSYLLNDVDTPDETISEDDLIEDPVYEITDVAQINNKINGYYRRDYRKHGSLGTQYMDMLEKVEGSGDMPTDVELKAVRISAMADHVLDWYLSQVSTPAKTISATTSWAHTDMSPATTFSVETDLYNAIYRLQQLRINQRSRSVLLKGASISNDYPYGINLVGYWKFDEGSGTTASDSSGHGNDGTLIGGPAWVDGVVGKALSFDGTDDGCDVADTEDINLTNVYTRTYSLWIKASSTTGIHTIHKEGGAINGFAIYTEDGILYFTYWANGSLIGYCSIPFTYTTWQHITCIFDSASGFQGIYLNGQEGEGSHWQDNKTGYVPSHSANINIGYNDSDGFLDHTGTHITTSYYFSGLIDEYRIYNRALTAEQTKSLYTYPKSIV